MKKSRESISKRSFLTTTATHTDVIRTDRGYLLEKASVQKNRDKGTEWVRMTNTSVLVYAKQ